MHAGVNAMAALSSSAPMHPPQVGLSELPPSHACQCRREEMVPIFCVWMLNALSGLLATVYLKLNNSEAFWSMVGHFFMSLCSHGKPQQQHPSASSTGGPVRDLTIPGLIHNRACLGSQSHFPMVDPQVCLSVISQFHAWLCL